MFELEVVARNVEKAVEMGLAKLGLTRDDVDIKILETGGLFKKAKVVLCVPEENLNKTEEIKSLVKLKNLEEKSKENPIQEKKEEHPQEKSEPEIKQNNPAPKQQKPVQKNNNSNQKNLNKPQESQPKNQVEKPQEQNQNIAKTINQVDAVKEFVLGIIEKAGLKVDISTREEKDEIFIDIIGEDSVKLIGTHGETLNALQYIVSIYSNNLSRHLKRVRVDVDNFKAKRRETIESLANRMARKVLETGNPITLEPMTPYERRLVHSVIYKYKDLKSHSTGKDPKRFLTISLANKSN